MPRSAVLRRRAGLSLVLFVSALGLSGCGSEPVQVPPEKAQESIKEASKQSSSAFFQNKTQKKAQAK
jgi:hypothetical protein